MPHMGLPLLRPGELRFPEAETPGIRIESWSNAARLLHVRGFTRDGILSFEHTTNSDRSRKAEEFTLPDWPQFLTVYPDTTPVRRGECYVRITLLAAGAPVGVLSAGYLTDSKTITWPPGVFEGFTEGPGYIRLVTGSDPAAGSEVSITVPTNAVWRLRSLRLRLDTDSTVANRRVALVVDDGSTVAFTKLSPAVQAESLTRYYNFNFGLGYEEGDFTADTISIGINDLIIPEGWRIRTITANLQAGDDYHAPILVVEEWIRE